jgi:hypothetical protein
VKSAVMITVWAGLSPPPLEPLPVPELAHLDVFTSRSSEEGRDRYRVHVGYFADPAAAERVLPRVREWYPSAWVVPANRHRPLARLKGRATPAWTGDEWVTPGAPRPEAALIEAASPAVPDLSTVIAGCAQASVPTSEPPPTADLAWNDDISLDTSEILALLEESAEALASAFPEPSVADPRANVELVPNRPVTALATPAAPPAATRPEVLSAFSRFSVEEWCAEPAGAAAPAARSWFKRLPELTRLAIKRRASG